MTSRLRIETPALRPGFYRRRIFPACLDREMDTAETRRIRKEVCGPLVGEVVEVGFGTGHNLPYLPATVSRLIAVEPDEYVRALADERLRHTTVAVEIVAGTAERLPLPDASVDAALSTWTLCTVDDPSAVLAEISRVLRPRRRTPLRRARPVTRPPSRPLAAPTQPTATALQRWLQPRPGHCRADQCVEVAPRGGQRLLPRR